MKRIKQTLIFTGLFLIGFNNLSAQDVPQPDFANVPAYYIKGTNELHNLAKESFNIVGTMNREALYELQGEKSKVRIKQTDDYIFVIKPFGEIDPSTIMQLKKMTITKKKNRQASMAQGQGLFTQSVNTSKGDVPYNLKKLGNNVFQIVPESKLEQGEYVFIVGGTPYSFTIE